MTTNIEMLKILLQPSFEYFMNLISRQAYLPFIILDRLDTK